MPAVWLTIARGCADRYEDWPMASDADTPDVDGQDMAEAYDEEVSLGDDNDSVDLDIAPDVYDSTHAQGDEDVDGDDDALDADEEDDTLLDTLGDTGEDEDDLDDDDEVDALDEDDLEGADLDANDKDDPDAVDGIGELEPDEADVITMEDIETNEIVTAGGRTADYESDTLSDADLEDLNYKDPASGAKRTGAGSVETASGAASGSAPDHARDDEAAGDLSPEDLDPSHHDHPERQSERLDEALEETFPGSDPVSVKHIT